MSSETVLTTHKVTLYRKLDTVGTIRQSMHSILVPQDYTDGCPSSAFLPVYSSPRAVFVQRHRRNFCKQPF